VQTFTALTQQSLTDSTCKVKTVLALTRRRQPPAPAPAAAPSHLPKILPVALLRSPPPAISCGAQAGRRNTLCREDFQTKPGVEAHKNFT